MDKEVSDMLNNTRVQKVDTAETDTEFQECEAHEIFRVFINKNDSVQEWMFKAVDGACVSEGP